MSAILLLLGAKLTVIGSPILNQPALLSRTGVINRGTPLLMIARPEMLIAIQAGKGTGAVTTQ